MGKFNRVKAEQIVNDVITNHSNHYGEVVYNPTGYLPYVNGDRFNGMLCYHNLRGSITKKLLMEFEPTQSYGKFINVFMDGVIRKSGIKVGICNFDSNSNPTYTEPEDIVPLDIKVVRGKDIIGLEEFIETI